MAVEARRFVGLEDILARAIERAEPAFVLALDSLEDPQNVGTLLRSAEAAGVHGVIYPVQRQAPISPAAVKASAGATEHLLLCSLDDLPGGLADLHVRGLRIVGADEDAPLTIGEADLRGPIAIVVGSEGRGMAPAIRRRCDLLVRIPMHGRIGSLNAAVAGSIVLFEAVGQRAAAAGTSAPAAKPARRRRGRPPAGPTAEPAAETTVEPAAEPAGEVSAEPAGRPAAEPSGDTPDERSMARPRRSSGRRPRA
ncbi:MAG TPA: RNA methyltransferase [Candidatus Limnocylindrales bacterium]|nr:RNA methyltransferase [Candidatus Limnocylindrales bacterium]